MVFKYQYEENVYKFLDNNVISDFIKSIADTNTAKMAYKSPYEKKLQHKLEQNIVLDFIKSIAYTKHGKNRFMNTRGTKKVPFRVPLIYSCCIKPRIAKEKAWQK